MIMLLLSVSVSTGNHRFSVSLFVWTNSHKLLSQIWRNVRVAVDEDSDRLLQRDCREVFHLQTKGHKVSI